MDLDVNRTYRNHEMFRERYNIKQRDLFHVLVAYSVYNTEVGVMSVMSCVSCVMSCNVNTVVMMSSLQELEIYY